MNPQAAADAHLSGCEHAPTLARQQGIAMAHRAGVPPRAWRRKAVHLLAVAATLALAACGGGSSGTPGSTECDIASQKQWLRDYMASNYLWAGASPNPALAAYATVPDYFNALLFTGNASVPADRWSYITTSAAFTQFFEEGKTLGYGLFVNGLEAQLPLKVRFVEAQSPAATQGLARGDVILAINGKSAAELIASGDFTALSPAAAGDAVAIEVATPAGSRTVTLTAANYTLTPVPTTSVLTLANGSKAGYLLMKDFIVQAEPALVAAFDQFRAAGATELILDLRYNGGGRISTSTVLASLVAGSVHDGKLFTQLRYNDLQSTRNTNFNLAAARPGFNRVVVLTGERTCSASELIVNGLAPHVQVVTVGGATCGKPYGFNPTGSCGSTFNAVNFESLNAAGLGRYHDGIAATCPAAEDFSGVLGSRAEVLTAVAAGYLETGVCAPVTAASAASRETTQSTTRRSTTRVIEPGEWRGMWAN
jgi:carboxyl-terminal processing protease